MIATLFTLSVFLMAGGFMGFIHCNHALTMTMAYTKARRYAVMRAICPILFAIGAAGTAITTSAILEIANQPVKQEVEIGCRH